MKGRSRFRFRYRGIMSALVSVIQSLGERFDDLLSSEETAGNDNVFYNPQDLTSLRVGTDGSGGSPAVGDPVGMMLDTSGLAGSMEEFLSSQPELVTNGTFDTDTTGWTTYQASIASSSGELVITEDGVNPYCVAYQTLVTTVGQLYQITVSLKGVNGPAKAQLWVSQSFLSASELGVDPLSVGDNQSFTFVAAGTTTYIQLVHNNGAGSGDNSVWDNISIKEIPGNHAIAPTDPARPILMDDPDTTWSSLTDDGTRGEELVTNGDGTTLDGWSNLPAGGAVLEAGEFKSTGGSYKGLSQQITGLEIGALYEASYDSYGSDYNTVQMWVGTGAGGLQWDGAISTISTPATKTTTTFQFYAQATSGYVNFRSNIDGGSGVAYFDNISVRKVNTAFDERASSFITTPNDVSSDTFLFDITASTDVIAAPDGSLTADLIQENGANNFHGFRQNPFEILLVGETYTAEVWLKAKERRYATLSLGASGAAFSAAIHVDVATGAVLDTSDTTLVSYEVTAGTNGWYKFSLTARATSLNSIFFVWLSDSPTTTFGGAYLSTVYQGDGLSGMYVWGYNLYGRASPNLLLNGTSDDDSTFDTDTGNWTKGTGWTISGGELVATAAAAINADYAGVLTVNRWYKAMVYVAAYTGGTFSIGSYGQAGLTTQSGTGWKEQYFRASHSTLSIRAIASLTADLDNVIIQELPSTTPTSYYLDTDGTDDWMQVTPTLNLGEQWWHTGAWQAPIPQKYAFSMGSSVNNGLVVTNPATAGWAWKEAAGSNVVVIPTDAGTKQVVTVEQYDTNSLSARSNGVQQVDPITPYDDSASGQALSLFTGFSIGFINGLNGRFYGGAWGQGQVDYDELTTLQDYLGTLVEPDIDPTDVTAYANVYEMLDAQTAAALFDIDDTTSLRVGRDGSGGVPVDGDPVGMMMDVSGTGGSTMGAYLEGAAELITNGTFDTDLTGWGAHAGDGSSAWSSGTLLFSGVTNAWRSQNITLPAGDTFICTFTLTGNGRIQLGGQIQGIITGASGETYTFIATSDGTNQIYLQAFADGTSFDNISVKALPGYVAVAASDAARPTLREDVGSGKFYLDFDGVDDNLILDGTDFGSSTNATLYKTFRGDTADTQQIMFASTTVGTWALVAGSGDPTTSLSTNLGTPVFRQDGAVKTYTSWDNVFTELIDNTDHTIGVEEADLTVSALWASNGFAIGGEFDTTYDSTGRLYSWAAVDTRLDGRNRDLLESFMISKKTS